MDDIINPFRVDWYALDQCYGLTKEMLYNIEQAQAQHKRISEVDELLYDMIVLNKAKCPASGKKYRSQPDWDAVQKCYKISPGEFKVLEERIEKGDHTVPKKELFTIMAIIKNRFRCEHSRPTSVRLPGDADIDWSKLKECYGRSESQLIEIRRKQQANKYVSKEDLDILKEITMNSMQCPPYWKEANKYNMIYWEKVDGARFEKCFGMTKEDFSQSWENDEASVFKGQCKANGETFHLPRIPFMGLLTEIAKDNTHVFGDDLTGLLPLLLSLRENPAKRKLNG